MGFDMYWRSRELTAEQEATLAAAKAEWRAAVDTRDAAFAADPSLRKVSMEPGQCPPVQQAVWDADERWRRAEVNYFRLNIRGMGVVLDVLAEAEVVHDRMDDQATPWPAWEDFGLTDYPETEEKVDGDWVSRQLTPAEQKFMDARTQKLAEGIEFPGIPAHKFGSNDGWIITPIECLSAGKQWEANRDRVAHAEYFDLADRFVTWLVSAAQHDGVEVH